MKDILQKLIAEAEESERLASAINHENENEDVLLGRLDRINRDTKALGLLTRECAELMAMIRNQKILRTAIPRHAKQVRILAEIVAYLVDPQVVHQYEYEKKKITTILAKLEEK